MNFNLLYILVLFVCFSCSNNAKSVVALEKSDTFLKLDNGILLYKSKPFTGNVVTNFSDGKLQSDSQYAEGFKHGYEKQWFSDSTLALERYYTKGLKSGTHKAWWEKGNLKFEYHFNNEGEYHGEVKEWFRSGDLYMSFNYENGIEAGSQRLWKPDGNIKANYEVVNGERFGLIGLKKCYSVSVNSDAVK